MIQTAAALQYSAYDDPKVWLREPAYEGPLSASELEAVQKEIDSILGTTRDNKSIFKVVWSGDRSYWKQYYDDWTLEGEPTSLYRRPWILYKTIYDSNENFIRDAFVPRYVILSRIEPEQYAETWKRESMIWDPTRGKRIAIRPVDPPKDWYAWEATIGLHNGMCCREAHGKHHCWGARYAHPRAWLEVARATKAEMIRQGDKWKPFASAAELRKHTEAGCHNYEEQSLERSAARYVELSRELPLSNASMATLESGPSLTRLRREASDRAGRTIDALMERLKLKRRNS